jgi:hypothetical protein
VPTAKLSDFIEGQVDYLKIDVEGAEDLVMRDLDASGKLAMVKQIFIEYHHHIRASEDKLSSLLAVLENNGFGYQLATANPIPQKAYKFQDVLIYAYRK